MTCYISPHQLSPLGLVRLKGIGEVGGNWVGGIKSPSIPLNPLGEGIDQTSP